MKRGRYISATIYLEREEEIEVKVRGYWCPLVPETGRFGPPEKYDQGSPESIEDITATVDAKTFILTEAETETVKEVIAEKARELWEADQL